MHTAPAGQASTHVPPTSPRAVTRLSMARHRPAAAGPRGPVAARAETLNYQRSNDGLIIKCNNKDIRPVIPGAFMLPVVRGPHYDASGFGDQDHPTHA